jgi:transposase
VSDEEWAFIAPYLCLMRENAPQRRYSLREVFDGLRYAVRAGEAWRMMPNDLPPWNVIYQQTRRWVAAGVFEAVVHDLRLLLRVCQGKHTRPTAAVIDSRTMRSTPESGARSGYDGYKRTKGSKAHAVVDTLGHLLALHVTPANEQERDQVERLARDVQDTTGENVTTLYADQGYTGHAVAADARSCGMELVVVGLKEARRGFVLLPKRWVIERSFAWASRFRRLARDHERLPEVLRGMHFLAFAVLMLSQLGRILKSA